MTFPLRRDLASIARRAASLHDRLTEPAGGSLSPSGLPASASVAKWRRLLDEGGPGGFTRRIAWHDLLSDSGSLDATPPAGVLPEWTHVLAAIMRAARNTATSPDIFCAHPPAHGRAARIPFVDLLMPSLLVARDELAGRLDEPLGAILSPAAIDTLELALLRRLAAISQNALYDLFDGTRTTGYSLVELLSPAPKHDTNRFYTPFVRRHLASGLLDLYCSYPVLGRLTALATKAWVLSTEKFVRDLIADYRSLHLRFGVPPSAKRRGEHLVASLSTDLSDPHDGGRSVIRVRFASGLDIIYKPRDTAPEECWSTLLAWLNAQGLRPRLLAPRAMASSRDHGWVQTIEPRACGDEKAGRRFYVRAGMLMALSYALGSADLHCENIIASGDHPVLIDCEMLLHPRVRPFPHSVAESDGWVHTVLNASLLPRWESYGDQRLPFDVSGLWGQGGQTVAHVRRRWRHVNTDGMTFVQQRARLPNRPNRPTLSGRPLDPSTHLADIVSGFNRMYRLLCRAKNVLMGSQGPLGPLANVTGRVLLRPTTAYLSLQNSGLETDCLRSGLARSICFERLAWAYVKGTDKPAHWPLLSVEIATLEALDVPRATAVFGSRCVAMGHATAVTELAVVSGLENTRDIVRQLGDRDRRRQLHIIRDALAAHAVAIDSPSRPQTSYRRRANTRKDVADTEVFVSAAERIGSTLEARSFQTSSGFRTWVGLIYDGQTNRFQPRPLGLSLYDGTIGVALFLAALHRATGGQRWRTLALRAIGPTRHALMRPELDACAAEAMGLGGLLLGLSRVGTCLADGELIGEAGAAARLLAQRAIEADRAFDVMGGSAGLLLALLEVSRATGDRHTLSLADRCGKRLLEAQCHGETCGGWVTVANWPLAGFAHGAAGIAYALERLNGACPSMSLRSAIARAMAFEDSLFVVPRRNWADIRGGPNRRRYSVAWCHGAAGIGMARARMSGAIQGLVTLEALRDCAATVKVCLEGHSDHLCCGMLGRVDALLELSTALADRSLMQLAVRSARRAAIDVLEGRTLRLFSPAPGATEMLGLFQGLSGVGYEFLRLTNMAEHPSVLLWA